MVDREIAPLHWNMILQAIHAGRCVPFLGAGVNVSTDDYKGLPLGGEVALRLLEKLLNTRVPELDHLVRVEPGPLQEKFQDLLRLRAQDLARVALHIQSSGDNPTLMSYLREILPDDRCEPSRLLETLAALPLQLVVTTNYDRLMERALTRCGEPPPLVVVQPIQGFTSQEQRRLQSQLAASNGTVLYKIHGTFTDERSSRLIVSEEDYIEFLTVAPMKNVGVPKLISEKLVDSVLLFLGYGLEDWDFRTIYKVLIEKLPNHDQRKSFAIQRKPSEFWSRFWAEKKVIIYDLDLYEFGQELERRYQVFLAEQGGAR